MLPEVDSRYENREEFAFIAWSSHWMNQQYDYRYLDDPPDAPGRAERPGPDNVDREQRFP
jgi:glycine betaine/proline transport system substrate-binding protein